MPSRLECGAGQQEERKASGVATAVAATFGTTDYHTKYFAARVARTFSDVAGYFSRYVNSAD